MPLSIVTIWVFEFCHNLSYRVESKFELSQFEYLRSHNLSFWVGSKFEFGHSFSLSFVTIRVRVLSKFEFCHNLSIWNLSQFKFLSWATIWVFELDHNLSFWHLLPFELSHFEFLSCHFFLLFFFTICFWVLSLLSLLTLLSHTGCLFFLAPPYFD